MLHSNTILIDWVRLCIHLICYTLTLLPYLHVCLNSLELYFLNKWYNWIVFCLFFGIFLHLFVMTLWACHDSFLDLIFTSYKLLIWCQCQYLNPWNALICSWKKNLHVKEKLKHKRFSFYCMLRWVNSLNHQDNISAGSSEVLQKPNSENLCLTANRITKFRQPISTVESRGFWKLMTYIGAE